MHLHGLVASWGSVVLLQTRATSPESALISPPKTERGIEAQTVEEWYARSALEIFFVIINSAIKYHNLVAEYLKLT